MVIRYVHKIRIRILVHLSSRTAQTKVGVMYTILLTYNPLYRGECIKMVGEFLTELLFKLAGPSLIILS